jgi:hypothetical protein
MGIIAPSKADCFSVEGQQAMIGNGHAVGHVRIADKPTTTHWAIGFCPLDETFQGSLQALTRIASQWP